MPEYEPRPFVCRHCSWILGESYREQGRRITQLRVYRHAQSIQAAQSSVPAEQKWSVIQVNDCTVLCEHCGAGNGWFANQTAITDMLERRAKYHQEVVHA